MDPTKLVRRDAQIALWLGAATVAAIAMSVVTEGAALWLLAIPVSWIGQMIFGFRGYGRGRSILRQHGELEPTMPLQESLDVHKWAQASLAVGLLGLVGGGLVLGLGVLAVMSLGAVGGAWGRPLRVGGRSVAADLDGGRGGHRWARGPRPDVSELDADTREALGRMWQHDAIKEHGSVPAFAQLTWQLAAAGAPDDLLERCHVSAIQEIEHTRRCFALCETYLGRTFEVGPIAALASTPSAHPTRRRLVASIALDTLDDGCLIEDLNADFAERAHALATDPAAKALAAMIAREEREHADLAWDILTWCVRTEPAIVPAVARRLARLADHVVVPYSSETMAVIRRADPAAMAAHARVPMAQWPEIFARRRAATVERAQALLARDGAPALSRAS